MRLYQFVTIIFLVIISTAQIFSQKSGQELTDSLIAEIPKLKADTNKVILLTDICFYLSSSDPDQGIKYGEDALKLSKDLNYGSGTAMAYRYLGICYNTKSLYPKSLDYYQKSLKKYESLKDKTGTAKVNLSIGLLYTNQKDYPNALKYLEAALQTFMELGNQNAIAKTWNNIGIVYTKMKNYPKALECYEKSLKLKEELGDVNGTESLISNMGTVYQLQGNRVLALKNFFRALDINKETEDKYYQAVHLGNIGNIYHDMALDSNNSDLKKYFSGDRQKAFRTSIAYLDSSITIYNEIGNLSDLYEYYKNLSEMQEGIGDLASALKNFKNYAAAKDSVFNEENTKKLVEMRLQYDFDKKEALSQQEIEEQKLLRNIFIGCFSIMLLFAVIFLYQRNRIRKANKRSEELLLNILPEEVADELKIKGTSDAKHYEEVSILFTDFKGFTSMAEKMNPQELVSEIDYCFRHFDEIIEKHGIEKIKTIGDAYMAVAGLPIQDKMHAEKIVRAGLDIRNFMKKYQEERKAEGKMFFEVRIGINTGEVVAGIVGVKKFAYDIWGDAVNTAARMESSSEVGKVNISETTYEKVKDIFTCEYRGEIDAKGKGKVKMYYVE